MLPFLKPPLFCSITILVLFRALVTTAFLLPLTIEFTNNNQNIEEIIKEIKSINPNFNNEEYEMKIYTLNEDTNYYTIDFIRQIDGFSTELGYNVAINNGKVVEITNNDEEIVSSRAIMNKLSEDEENNYKCQGIEVANQKAIDGIFGNDFKNGITAIEQYSDYYFDVSSGKKYYNVFTTFVNTEGAVEADSYSVEL